MKRAKSTPKAAAKRAAKAIWAANPELSAASVQMRLAEEGHQLCRLTIHLLRPKPRVLRKDVDPEPTRAVLRARAAELGFAGSDRSSLPHGSFVAIARASRKRGHAVAPGVVRHAWIYGVRDLEQWPLCRPFLSASRSSKAAPEKKDAPSP